MTLGDLMASDMAMLLNTDDFAQSASYTEPDGTVTSLTVVRFNESTETPDTDGIKTKVRSQDCAWSAATLSAINFKAKITIGDEDWSIANLVHRDDYQVVVRLERHELMEHTRPDFRRTR